MLPLCVPLSRHYHMFSYPEVLCHIFLETFFYMANWLDLCLLLTNLNASVSPFSFQLNVGQDV